MRHTSRLVFSGVGSECCGVDSPLRFDGWLGGLANHNVGGLLGNHEPGYPLSPSERPFLLVLDKPALIRGELSGRPLVTSAVEPLSQAPWSYKMNLLLY
jgi:hypothetical protein